MLKSQDLLYTPNALIPPRPTISTVQWVTGTQYITPTDIDVLIGGPDRPPSKRMIAQARAEEQLRREGARAGTSSSATTAAATTSTGGYWDYMQKQIQERTEQLGLVGDSMERVEANSKGWADDVNKFVKDTKKNAVTGSMSCPSISIDFYTFRFVGSAKLTCCSHQSEIWVVS